ncbi:hypothetical protein [Mesoplasma seiffertii]|uniref:hypothetical protein n=1 Tax=Mesoplasma seiffertii TaxID=28224 RepID=UPI00047D6DC7|nr:hypothetical protein [Mesoplasma seiffertii]
MITKVKNDFYIEKNHNRFYIKDFNDNTLMVCNNYLDAIVELENIYTQSIKNPIMKFHEDQTKLKKEGSDLKFDQIADLINLKINNLEHNLKNQIAQMGTLATAETIEFQNNNKLSNTREVNVGLQETEENWVQEKEMTTDEYSSVFEKILEINNTNSLNFKSFEKTIKTLTDQLSEKIENNEKRYSEIMFENLVSDSKINDLDNSLKSVILNLNQIKENCLDKSFRNELCERESEMLESFNGILNNEMSTIRAQLLATNSEIQSLKNNQSQMLNQNEFNELLNKNNFQIEEAINSLKAEILENKFAIESLTDTCTGFISNQDLREVENKVLNELDQFKAIQESHLEIESNNLKERMTSIAKELDSLSASTNNHVSLDKVNNIKVEMFKAFQDELKLVKTSYEDKMQKSEKKFKTNFEALKKEFVESLDLLLTLNSKMKDLVSQDELNSIKKKWILEANKKMLSAS